jgi:hypothetical protein
LSPFSTLLLYIASYNTGKIKYVKIRADEEDSKERNPRWAVKTQHGSEARAPI